MRGLSTGVRPETRLPYLRTQERSHCGSVGSPSNRVTLNCRIVVSEMYQVGIFQPGAQESRRNVARVPGGFAALIYGLGGLGQVSILHP